MVDKLIDILQEKNTILLIVPPFAQVEFQSLAIHTLQALAKKEGFSVKIFYANIHLASILGPDYTSFCEMNYFLLGERMFAKAAWGDKVPNQIDKTIYNYRTIYDRDYNPLQLFPQITELSRSHLKKIEAKIENWMKILEDQFQDLSFSYVGITSSFEQNNAAMAILQRIKKANPKIKTLFGGYNCEGENAKGIRSLDPDSQIIDYIFSGESENTFLEFIKNGNNEIFPEESIIIGSPLKNLDDLPDLDYSDYFTQIEKYLPRNALKRKDMSLVMETSRGCWWGEKNQCRFCGTSERICFREKSSNRIIKEIKAAEKWNISKLHMADLIMPEKNFEKLLPLLKENGQNWEIYYEQKVITDYKKLALIKDSGISKIQPGIESFSTELLKKMRKGLSLKQNLIFLKNALLLDLDLYWNIVWGIPGETNKEYKKMNSLIPLISHLHPPVGIFYMTLIKYSPYYNEPHKYGIKDIRPLPSYSVVYPDGTLLDKIALIYTCKYKTETMDDQNEIDKLIASVERWNLQWKHILTRPRLQIELQDDNKAVLIDTRRIDGNKMKNELTKDQINELRCSKKYTGTSIQNWALNIKAAILEENEIIPLVIINPEVIKGI